MNSDFDSIAAAGTATETTERAQEVLDDLMARVGVDGLTAALANPGLLAAVDQHAAAVREALRRAGHRRTAVNLARYAGSITAAAYRMGRPLPEPGEADWPRMDWRCAQWHLVRLVAVCAIADEAGLL